MAIAGAVEEIQERIQKACARAGRKAEEVRLMGVSKFQDAPLIDQAWQAGIRLFGESRVQEAAGKFAGFKEAHPGTELHLIGSLQRNKAKIAAGLFDVIQSVDRDELIAELGNLTGDRKNPLMILLEYHTAEDSKSGYRDLDSLCRAAERALEFSGLSLGGLMTMAPFTEEEAPVRASFRALAAARNALAARFPAFNLACLSMGMSNDFEIAIEEGSTLVRIGTAIFGERAP
ncbi:pyridoxal phosphate enzyme, YggS family [Treponema primitia ZAS-2]|uniref:Pyridoxal phosphate homeostasis protein n=1 Tax=Treponema primitia (strain ATCC BAA-887 / DSM 12427 / ZAS-2) TaxID=545694 RepID=F5YIY6_TREPZ|nr:YggS family pyridoxal phosphate-dependent enzyme [Treponema primitia]AEF85007.1 pyridoxal phosphate enzyme, YggS family [Treponema primitia ZAS-2]